MDDSPEFVSIRLVFLGENTYADLWVTPQDRSDIRSQFLDGKQRIDASHYVEGQRRPLLIQTAHLLCVL